MNKKVIVIGAGGHAKVIADIIEKSNDKVVGFLDDHIPVGAFVSNYEIIGTSEDAKKFNDCEFIIGIGSNDIRFNKSKLNLKWYTAIHPSAIIGNHVTIDEGTVIMANATINPASSIGKHCIINTGTIIEHDNVIDDYVHISPHATCCGTVHVGEFSHVGAGATIINNINITSHCIIGAGSVVVKDIDVEGTYLGVPIRKVK